MGIWLKGRVKGRVIELGESPNLPDGTNLIIDIEVAGEPEDKVDPSFLGIWRDREDIGNGAEWVRKIRESQWRSERG